MKTMGRTIGKNGGKDRGTTSCTTGGGVVMDARLSTSVDYPLTRPRRAASEAVASETRMHIFVRGY